MGVWIYSYSVGATIYYKFGNKDTSKCKRFCLHCRPCCRLYRATWPSTNHISSHMVTRVIGIHTGKFVIISHPTSSLSINPTSNHRTNPLINKSLIRSHHDRPTSHSSRSSSHLTNQPTSRLTSQHPEYPPKKRPTELRPTD